MPSDANAALVDLQSQIAHLQRLYDQLNEVVTEQALASDRMRQRIDELEKHVKRLKERAEPSEDPLDEKPPHY